MEMMTLKAILSPSIQPFQNGGRLTTAVGATFELIGELG
jgi:hypothetical protein